MLAFSGDEEFGGWRQVVFPPLAALAMAVTAGGLRHRAFSFGQLLALLACACGLVTATEPSLLPIVAAVAGALGVGLRHLRTWLLGRRLGRPGTGGLAVESSVRAVLRWTLAILVASAVVALPLSREIWG